MERYVINGTEVEYDTFDLDNMERLETASEKVRAAVRARSADKSSIAEIRRICEAMLHFLTRCWVRVRHMSSLVTV